MVGHPLQDLSNPLTQAERGHPQIKCSLVSFSANSQTQSTQWLCRAHRVRRMETGWR
jgi:hypothetical protein